MLELRDPVDAFDRLERYLGDSGFFGTVSAEDSRCADVYLGYGLSAPMRRSSSRVPPEPADLPLAACRIRLQEPSPAPRRGRYEVGPWETSWSAHDYGRAITLARDAIAAGEVYQINLVQHLSATFRGDPAMLQATLAGLAPRQPRPLGGPGWSIVSASPELFLARRGRRIWTEPIKGTRPSGEVTALRSSAKDAAEHVMIVDLERNDLGRICEPGSVRWPELMTARSMAGVEHLVSRVEGIVKEGTGLAAALAAMFPGGSVTGAPKIAALDHINELEPVGRGASMGALGTVWPNGDFDLALTIRTFAVADGRIHLWVGGGIVWDSRPDGEVEESWTKARPLLDALEAGWSQAVLA